MIARRILRLLPGIALGGSLFLLDSCAVPLGPGYTIEKQTLDVHFVAQPQPHLEIRAWYRLVNSGNQPLSSIQVGLPSAKLFDLENLQVQLDGREIAPYRPTGAADESSKVAFDPPWPQKQRHELTILYAISHSLMGSATVPMVVEDAFYLPPVGWYPELRPPKSTFAKLSGPPKKWDFAVRVPENFLVHAGGHEHGSKKSGGETEHRFEQRPGDFLPFVIAGHYEQTEVRSLQQTIFFWTRKSLQTQVANRAGETIAQATRFFDSSFGPRGKSAQPVWVAECPVKAIFSNHINSGVFFDGIIVCQPLPDVALVHLDIFALGSNSLIESLSPSWFGYGLGRGMANLSPLMDMLPRYAARVATENQRGPGARNQDVVNALEFYWMLHKEGRAAEKRDSPDYEKSLLFFYALEDQYGRDHLHHAIARMIHARRRRGYDTDDLRSALEAETGQDVAAFFHRWLDKPGIPDDFRARYLKVSPSTADAPKEMQP